jgi:hypothetical protein
MTNSIQHQIMSSYRTPKKDYREEKRGEGQQSKIEQSSQEGQALETLKRAQMTALQAKAMLF